MTAPANSGAATVPCASCGAPLAATARFCHQCGTAVGFVAVPRDAAHRQAVRLPWLLAATALVGATAFLLARAPDMVAAEAPFARGAMGGAPAAGSGGGAGGPPDIANMTPSERANRLYGRVMAYAEAGKADSAAFFAPMAMAAHQMLDNATLDERYHLGRIAEIVGDADVAAAQADTILRLQGDNLLGLLLTARAARLQGNDAKARTANTTLLRVLEAQLATRAPEYEMHKVEIQRAVDDARRP